MRLMTAKPVIGVVADTHDGRTHRLHTVQEKYLDAISAGADAFALILPARIDRPGASWTAAADLEQALDAIDGLFLSGAVSNIDPGHYGAALADPNSPADPARDAVTLMLARRAIGRGMPVLGVCRGFQEVNVALGGTLHQAVHDTPGYDDHRDDHEASVEQQYGPAHPVRFAPGGMLHLMTGREGTLVNSLHGQGIEHLAPGLIRDAEAPDGLIEAFRGAGEGFVLGVQWHPEWRFREDPVSLAIFRSFGAAARAWAGRTRAAQASPPLALMD